MYRKCDNSTNFISEYSSYGGSDQSFATVEHGTNSTQVLTIYSNKTGTEINLLYYVF